MRIAPLAGLGLLVACIGTQASVTPTPRIFRDVHLSTDTLRLAQPLGALARFARRPSDSLVTIPHREFGGADEIEVHRAPDGSVRRVVFLYAEQRNARALLAEYRQSLGLPADSSVRDTPRGRWHTWWWRDEQTEFAFIVVEPAFEGMGGLSILQVRGAGLAFP